MKKFLSIILAVSLLFSGLVFASNAADNKLPLGSEIRCNYTGETLVYTFTPTADVQAVLYTKDADEGIDTNVFVYRTEYDGEYGYSDDKDYSFNFFYSALFEAGYTYTFEISDYFGTLGEFTLVFEEHPVDYLEITNVPEVSVDMYGYISPVYEGITVTIHYKDPAREAQTVVFGEESFAEADGFFLQAEYWQEDTTKLCVSFMDLEEYVNVTTNEKQVADFEIITPPSGTLLYKDIDCIETAYLDEETGELVSASIYNVYYFGAVVRISYEDGTYTDISYDEDSDFFLMLENDLDSQLTTPWDIGTHTVNLIYNGISASFEVEVAENPYVKAEITKLPTITKSLHEGSGYPYSDDQDQLRYFYYDTPLAGIEITLTDKDGNTKVIKDDLSVLLKLHAVTDQETSPWSYGDHNVDVYYGNMLVGTYVFTVTNQHVVALQIRNKASAAFYYVNESDYEFDPEDMLVQVSVAGDGDDELIIPYEDLAFNEYGVSISVSFDYDETENNYYYYVYASNQYTCSKPVYFERIYTEVTNLEVTNPPASLIHVADYGLDIYNSDLSGLEVTVTLSNGQTATWYWDDSDKDGRDVFLGGIIEVGISSYGISVYYRGFTATCEPDTYKTVADYSNGIIDKNTTLELDLGQPGLCVYTFTPWNDGTYDFSVDGEALVLLGIFDENGYFYSSTLYEEQIFINSDSETFSMECYEGETYYLLLERIDLFDLFGESDNGKIDFSVNHAVCGDADGDGEVSVKDVLTIRKYLAGIIDDYELDLSASDADGDGEVSVKDVLTIRKYLAGIIDSIPI